MGNEPWRYDLDLSPKRLHAKGLTDGKIAAEIRMRVAKVTAAHVADARRRLELPENTVDSACGISPPQPLAPKARPSPLEFARGLLEGRLTERAGSYWLDGSPARLDDIMRAANRVALARNAEPLLASDRWKP